ncbi:hypothetical protein [Atopomonas sediminilitoris]|uniref:hypothetical protein n=1 Tax=Atopomonas sediminilitoris TaxID=2919919 RepID=UPI001F4DCB71|nr:hypothetical protein [Atopomonas sediminilitoris]MCJ8169301.1 hypothetical protein [Atopomonas sediminilitoris]
MDLPFLSMFPRNCCEIASLVLGKVLVDEYPEKEIFMVKAELAGHGRHFWLKSGKEIYDITADQFEEIERPIIGELSSPLAKKYKAYEVSEIRSELAENDFGIHISIFSEISKTVREMA